MKALLKEYKWKLIMAIAIIVSIGSAMAPIPSFVRFIGIIVGMATFCFVGLFDADELFQEEIKNFFLALKDKEKVKSWFLVFWNNRKGISKKFIFGSQRITLMWICLVLIVTSSLLIILKAIHPSLYDIGLGFPIVCVVVSLFFIIFL